MSNDNLRMPFYVLGNPNDSDLFAHDKHIVIISDVGFTIGEEWGDQAHRKQCHKEYYDADIGIYPGKACPDEHVYEKHVFSTQEEALKFMATWMMEHYLPEAAK